MPRYIEATEAIRVLSEYYKPITDAERYAIALVISEIQSADVVERKRGKWEHGYCSECGYNWGKDAPIASVPNFCPNCGARMDSREDPSHPFADDVMMVERSEDG